MPLGVSDVQRPQFINVDEFRISLEQTNKKYGYALTVHRVRTPGHYTRDVKLTVLFAIDPGNPGLPGHLQGSVQRPRRWIRVLVGRGTTITTYSSFLDSICSELEDYRIPNTNNHRVFLHDNLYSHLAPLVITTVENRGGDQQFTIVSRPPYQPKYRPIEYKICDLLSEVKIESKKEWSLHNLEQELYRAAVRIGPF